MIDKIKSMGMSGLRMLTTKKGMLAAMLFIAPIAGIAVNPEIASNIAEHLSALLDMLLDGISGGEAPGHVDADKAANVG